MNEPGIDFTDARGVLKASSDVWLDCERVEITINRKAANREILFIRY